MADVHALATSHENLWASAGLLPDRAGDALEWVEPWLGREGVVAVGETGLDYHHESSQAGRRRQRSAFAAQLAMAQRSGFPVIVHTRAACADTLAIMREQPAVRGVLHCFTESEEMAAEALALGYYISFSGIVTFKSAGELRDVVTKVPLDRLLIETDAPWLAPVPHRGKTNSPALLPHTAALIAQLRDLPLAEFAQHTRSNFERLFNVQMS